LDSLAGAVSWPGQPGHLPGLGPKLFIFCLGKKIKTERKKTGKRAKWANQQDEQNLKTSFTLSLSLLSLARYTYIQSHTHTTSTACRALFDHHASVTTPSPPKKLQAPVHNNRLSLFARKSPFTKSMKILEYF
jgi:hypothetical protein